MHRQTSRRKDHKRRCSNVECPNQPPEEFAILPQSSALSDQYINDPGLVDDPFDMVKSSSYDADADKSSYESSPNLPGADYNESQFCTSLYKEFVKRINVEPEEQLFLPSRQYSQIMGSSIGDKDLSNRLWAIGALNGKSKTSWTWRYLAACSLLLEDETFVSNPSIKFSKQDRSEWRKVVRFTNTIISRTSHIIGLSSYLILDTLAECSSLCRHLRKMAQKSAHYQALLLSDMILADELPQLCSKRNSMDIIDAIEGLTGRSIDDIISKLDLKSSATIPTAESGSSITWSGYGQDLQNLLETNQSYPINLMEPIDSASFQHNSHMNQQQHVVPSLNVADMQSSWISRPEYLEWHNINPTLDAPNNNLPQQHFYPFTVADFAASDFITNNPSGMHPINANLHQPSHNFPNTNQDNSNPLRHDSIHNNNAVWSTEDMTYSCDPDLDTQNTIPWFYR